MLVWKMLYLSYYSDLPDTGKVVTNTSVMVKAAVVKEVEDMLIMETKLKIIEILQVATTSYT